MDRKASSPERALRWTSILIFAGIVAALMILPLGIGIWLPDVFIDREHTLAQQRLADGHEFRIIQYWNHGDFYNTELLHTAPDGTVLTNVVLDPDDGKRWRASVTVNEDTRQATVALSGRGPRTISW
jgi:hypothetical protein